MASSLPARMARLDTPMLCSMRRVPCSRSWAARLKASAMNSRGNRLINRNAGTIWPKRMLGPPSAAGSKRAILRRWGSIQMAWPT
ncbi:hypothetical protein D3C81_1949620 [compost metagenome]